MTNANINMEMYKEAYHAMCNLPMVVRLKNDNKALTKRVILYKHKIQVLEDMLYRTIQDNHKCKKAKPLRTPPIYKDDNYDYDCEDEPSCCKKPTGLEPNTIKYI